MKSNIKNLQLSLLLLRIGVFIVMAIWTVDKFVNPGHGAKIFEKFYAIAGVEHTMIYIMGAAQAVLMLLFLVGRFKRFTYGLVLLMHAGSTFSSFSQYMDPFNHLLFFAAWPMLAACIALYLLREDDEMFNL